MIVTLVVAAIAAAAGVAAGVITAQVTIAAQRQDSIREKRAEVYAAYLGAADKYSIMNGRYIKAIEAMGGADGEVDPVATEKWTTARSAYQDQVNQVYIYGSDEAWAAHLRLASVLPASVLRVVIVPVDSTRFFLAYQGFQSIMCQELVAEPREGCGDH